MENLTFKINGLEFEVEKQMTTLKGVRTIVSYAIEKYNLDKKTANLTLPNGAIIKVKTLNNTKLFEAMLLPSIVLLDKEDESNLEIIEALDWFEIKGEVYRVSPTLIDDRVEYISEVMDEGAFITIGKQEERWEAEALIMNYYLNIYLDNKINRLKRYKNEN